MVSSIRSYLDGGLQPSDIGHRLDCQYAIMTRVGLHCAPGAHRTIGTSPLGTVRMSLGYGNTQEQVAVAVGAIAEIAEKSR